MRARIRAQNKKDLSLPEPENPYLPGHRFRESEQFNEVWAACERRAESAGPATMRKHFLIIAKCANGHVEEIRGGGLGLEWAMILAGLLDGSSPLYQPSPIGTDRIIGKCGICLAQLKCTAEGEPDQSDPPEAR